MTRLLTRKTVAPTGFNSTGAIYMSINGKFIRFTKTACEVFKLNVKDKIAFENTGNRWAIVKTEDGFSLHGDNRNGALRMCNISVANEILKSTGRKSGVRFYLLSYQDQITIVTDKSYDEFLNEARYL